MFCCKCAFFREIFVRSRQLNVEIPEGMIRSTMFSVENQHFEYFSLNNIWTNLNLLYGWSNYVDKVSC